jgi:ankyrin repeat protein
MIKRQKTWQKGFGLFVVALGVVFLAQPSQAQMPADTQFLEDIRDRKYADTMSYLVNGGTPNARDYNGIPAIVAAARIGDAGMVKELIKYGGTPDMSDKRTGVTALMEGAARGNIYVVAVLVTNEADIAMQDDLGETALIKAVKEGRREIVNQLIDVGADPYMTDYTGYSAYDHAMRSRDMRMKNLMKKAVSNR